MKYLILVLFLLPAVTFHAQGTSWNVQETECDTSYEFSLRYSKLTEESMNEIIRTVSEGKVKGRFTGRIATTFDDGVTLSMHTDRRQFAVTYTGDDTAAMAHAKSIATDISTQVRNLPDRR